MSNGLSETLKNLEKLGAPSTAFDAAHPPVIGVAHPTAEAGILGLHRNNGAGVAGVSQNGAGVAGLSEAAEGVRAESRGGNGIDGTGALNGVVGRTNAAVHSGILGLHSGGGRGVSGLSEAPGGIGVWGSGARLAGQFIGDVEVTGKITTHDVVLNGGDCAEDFDIDDIENIEPGTVMVISDTGVLCKSSHAYDKRVAGVISGAGGYQPGIVLDKQDSRDHRLPIALLGKVYCKVDANYASVEVGDLLTTSPTPGHAMKADDPLKAFGAVIGKAMRPFKSGQGIIPILIALQ